MNSDEWANMESMLEKRHFAVNSGCRYDYSGNIIKMFTFESFDNLEDFFICNLAYFKENNLHTKVIGLKLMIF